MDILTNMPVMKERYRSTTIRKFPDSVKGRLWAIKQELKGDVTIEAILLQALKEGLPLIERRVFFRIPDHVEDPSDEKPV